MPLVLPDFRILSVRNITVKEVKAETGFFIYVHKKRQQMY